MGEYGVDRPQGCPGSAAKDIDTEKGATKETGLTCEGPKKGSSV